MDPVALQRAVESLGYWYHRIELPGGVITPGWAPMIPSAYRVPEDLRGARVLDVGAWDGYWTWEALRRGADQVVAIDDFSDHRSELAHRGDPWSTFDLCREALGYDETKVKRYTRSVYELGIGFGDFDVVLFFGVLYHCRHPLLALDRLSGVAPSGDIYIETAIVDERGAYSEKGYPQIPIMEFYPTNEYGSNPTNWWGPTLAAVISMVNAAGWPKAQAQYFAVPQQIVGTPTEMPFRRGFVQGKR